MARSLHAPVKGISIGITLLALGLSGCNWGQSESPARNETSLGSMASPQAPNAPSNTLGQEAPSHVGSRNLPLTTGMRAFGSGLAQTPPHALDQRPLNTQGQTQSAQGSSSVAVEQREEANLGSNSEVSLSSPLEAKNQSPDPQSSVRPESEGSAQTEVKGDAATGVVSADVNAPAATSASDASAEKGVVVQAPAPDHDMAHDSVADAGAEQTASAGTSELPIGQTGPQAPSASAQEEFAELNRKVEELDALPIVKSTRSGGESEDSSFGGGGGGGKATGNGSGFLGVLSSKSLDFSFGKKSVQPDSGQSQGPAQVSGMKNTESAPRLPAAAGQAVVSGSQSGELIDFFVGNPVLGSFCEASENYIRRGLESAAAPSTRNSRSGLALIRQDLGLPEVVGGPVQSSTATGDRELQLVREAVERARRSESLDSLETSLQRYLSEKGREVPAETIRCGSGESLVRDPQSAVLRDGVFGVACRSTSSSTGELLPPLQVSRVEVLTGRDETGAAKTSLRICSYLGGRGVVNYPVLNYSSYQAGQTGSIVFERMVNRQEGFAMTRCADLNVLTGEITLQDLSDDEPNRLGEQSLRSWIIAQMPERCESHRVGLPSDRK
jgi:hypothetical protein